MKTVTYKRAGDVGGAEVLKGRTLNFPEAETLDDVRSQVQEGADIHVVRAAQSAIDITKQRLVRSWAASEDITNILAGKAEGTADMSDAERQDGAVAQLQTWLDEYVYGSRPAGTGEGKRVKAAAAAFGTIAEKAAADPQVRATLIATLGKEQAAALGIDVSDVA
jgi:hypothetical protein